MYKPDWHLCLHLSFQRRQDDNTETSVLLASLDYLWHLQKPKG